MQNNAKAAILTTFLLVLLFIPLNRGRQSSLSNGVHCNTYKYRVSRVFRVLAFAIRTLGVARGLHLPGNFDETDRSHLQETVIMKIKLKKLADQVIVITGATSGIGLVTARMAARRGARLVLAARNETALSKMMSEDEFSGGNAIAVKTDVGNIQDVRRVACKAVETFGSIDTWVNNAGVSIYGRISEVPDDDHRRLFQTR